MSDKPEPIDPHMIVAEDRFPDEPEPTEAQPMSEDYIRGYDAGFIVGAEKGRSEPTEAQVEAAADALIDAAMAKEIES